MILRAGLAFAALLFGPVQAAAQVVSAAQPAQQVEARPPKLPTMSFTKDNGLSDMDLSPDGKSIALRSTRDGKVSVYVLDTDTRTVQRRIGVPDKNELDWFSWAGNGKLLLAMSAQTDWFGEDARISRLFVYHIATQELAFIGKKEMGLEGDDVLRVDPAGEWVLLAMQKTIYDYPSVWRFPLTTKPNDGAKEVQRQKTGVWDWYADSSGTVRMGLEPISGGRLKIHYRSKPEDPLREIAKLGEDSKEEDYWDVARIVSGSDEGYVLKPDDNGRLALRKFNYATRTVGEVIYAVPGWDIDSADIDEQDKPVAVFYTDDRDRVVWFDPKMKSFQSRLDRALKGKEVWVFSRAKDDSRALVWAGSASDPGQVFIYNEADKRLDAFSSYLPDLDIAALADPKPIAYTARDQTEISGYLTLPRGREPKNLPLIVLPHGGPYGVRDKLDFDAEVQFLANRGYAVLQPNYRGSGGFGDKFEELGNGQIGRNMQDDIDDAMDWAVREGYADPARVCVIGSSYGGYAALWAVIRNPERYRCAASFAGVTDWKRQLKYNAKFLTGKGMKSWRTTVEGEDKSFDLDQVSPVVQIGRLTRPVLLAHGEKDTRVPFKQFSQLRDAASKAGKPIDLLVFPDEGHGFDKPENEARWLDAVEAFLAKNNPAD